MKPEKRKNVRSDPVYFGRKGKQKSPWRGGHLQTANTLRLKREWERTKIQKKEN